MSPSTRRWLLWLLNLRITITVRFTSIVAVVALIALTRVATSPFVHGQVQAVLDLVTGLMITFITLSLLLSTAWRNRPGGTP